MNTLFENSMDVEQGDLFTYNHNPRPSVTDWMKVSSDVVSEGEIRSSVVNLYRVKLDNGEEELIKAMVMFTPAGSHHSGSAFDMKRITVKLGLDIICSSWHATNPDTLRYIRKVIKNDIAESDIVNLPGDLIDDIYDFIFKYTNDLKSLV